MKRSELNDEARERLDEIVRKFGFGSAETFLITLLQTMKNMFQSGKKQILRIGIPKRRN